MIDIHLKSDIPEEEIISAFAYSTGKLIEELIKKQTHDLEYSNKYTEAKILQFLTFLERDFNNMSMCDDISLGDLIKRYREHFRINTIVTGVFGEHEEQIIK
jgi:hypothetical protein